MKSFPILAVIVTLITTGTAMAAPSFVEDFTSTAYEDTALTTAEWNTTDGELRLPKVQPIELGHVDAGVQLLDLALSGHTVFAATSVGMAVFDVSDPTSPTLLSTWAAPAGAYAIEVSGNMAYLAAGNAGVIILDVHNPAIPSQVGLYNTPGSARGIAADGSILYVADGTAGLVILDVSIPTTPTLRAIVDTPGNALDVARYGSYVYVADESSVRIIDVTDPSYPSSAGSVGSQNPLALDVKGDLLMVTGANATLEVMEIAVPDEPDPVGFYESSSPTGYARSVSLFGEFAYVANGSAGVEVIDIADTGFPQLHVSMPPSLDSVMAVMTDGDLLYSAESGGRLSVAEARLDLGLGAAIWNNILHNIPYFSLASGHDLYICNRVLEVIKVDPLGVSSIVAQYNGAFGEYDTSMYGMVKRGNFIYLVENPQSGSAVIESVDVSNPAFPTTRSYEYLPLSFYWGGVAVGATLYTGSSQGLQGIDISSPDYLTTYPILTYSGGLYPIEAFGQYLLCSINLPALDQISELAIVDVSSPLAPAVVGTYVPGSDCYFFGVKMMGNNACVKTHDAIEFVDCSSPASPTLLGSFPDSSGYFLPVPMSLVVSGTTVFTRHNDEVWVVDASDPANPVFHTSQPRSYIEHMQIVGDNLFLFQSDANNSNGYSINRIGDRRLDSTANVGHSTTCAVPESDVVRMRLGGNFPTEVMLELSADGGGSWMEPSMGTWTQPGAPGRNLQWRSTHTWGWTTLSNPTCHDLTIEWLTRAPRITAIADVPEDQGGWARLHLERSGQDFVDDPDPIQSYGIWRNVDPAKVANTGGVEPEDGESLVPDPKTLPSGLAVQTDKAGRRLLDRTSCEKTGTFPPGTWEFIGSVPAMQQDETLVLVPTLADSSGTTTYQTTFVVTAHTGTPSVWYISQPEAGWSVDNIAPAAPTGLVADYGSPTVLNWDAAPESDFGYFQIYRGMTPDFVADENTRIDATTEPTWSDTSPNPFAYFYKISAVDHVGNESEVASPTTTSDVQATVPAVSFSQPTPNPFNPRVNISLSLPRAGRVEVGVFDVLGHRIRTLVDGDLEMGTHQITWDGTMNTGSKAPSGLYFFLMKAAGTQEVRRAVMVR